MGAHDRCLMDWGMGMGMRVDMVREGRVYRV